MLKISWATKIPAWKKQRKKKFKTGRKPEVFILRILVDSADYTPVGYSIMASLFQRVKAAVKLPIEEEDAERSRWINEG